MAKKQKLSYQEIEKSLEVFKNQSVPASEVGYEILKAFGKSDADIRRYRDGKGVLSTYGGLLIKGLFAFKTTDTLNLTSELANMKCDVKIIKAAPKIIAVSDGNTILAYDMREKESYENPLNRLYCDFAFFYPLCGIERFRDVEESPADVKAAEKLAKLHDELRVYNEFSSHSELHDLNIFIARLLFCFFAEDTGIFEDNLFTASIVRYTKDDGSDLSNYLDAAFNIMDVKERSADTLKIISQFPYVNGGLFAKHIQIPKMGYKARKLIIECGELDWKNINPDIFGSMIQAVVDPNVRANQGMHYTSVPNILKVINPLFMDDLRAEYQKLVNAFNEKKNLLDMGMYSQRDFDSETKPIHRGCEKLLLRMSKMKFFDPACGSGNFLIITYKMLRVLELDILRLMRQISPEWVLFDTTAIQISQFYGIELLDFPHEIAMLSLWLAQHQMDRKLFDEFGVNTQALPLHNITQIVCGNACRIDWDSVCPHTADEEVYVFGNPPYLGSKLQDSQQKSDVAYAFKGLKNSKILDYIAIWFYYASKYIRNTKAKYAFVTTNSICQGEQVSILWPEIFGMKEEISFAYQSFRWSNNAKHNAGVTVVIVGVQNTEKSNKHLFTSEQNETVIHITPYLAAGENTIVYKRTAQPEGFPKLVFGSMPYDSGNLLLESNEYKNFLAQYPEASKFTKRIYGSEEFINDKERYCLWIDDADLEEAKKNPFIADRIEKTRKMRLESKDGQKLADKSHQFREHPDLNECIIIPRVSSETREYIPIGFLSDGNVVSDSAFALYDAPLWLFGILTSRMHMAWVRAVGGKLETRYRYSAGLCYNPFPFPTLSDKQKHEIEAAAEEVILIREDFPGKTLAELYDAEKMPAELREAHRDLDDIVDSCYPGYPFANDEARLETLFKLYEKVASKNKK